MHFVFFSLFRLILLGWWEVGVVGRRRRSKATRESFLANFVTNKRKQKNFLANFVATKEYFWLLLLQQIKFLAKLVATNQQEAKKKKKKKKLFSHSSSSSSSSSCCFFSIRSLIFFAEFSQQFCLFVCVFLAPSRWGTIWLACVGGRSC